MTIIQNLGVQIRKWSDVSSKVKATLAGGVTAGGVTSILALVLPDWHPASWIVALITLAAAVASGYLKGEKVSLDVGVNSTASDGTVTSTVQSFDLPLHPLVAQTVLAQQAADAAIGGGETDDVAADGSTEDDTPKHAA